MMQMATLFSFLFITQVFPDVAGAVERTVRVREGETVTLRAEVTGQRGSDRITWLFGSIMIAESPATEGDIYKTYTDIFKGRLQLDRQTGALTIKSVHIGDRGVYILQMIKNGVMSTRNFNCSVYTQVSSPTIRRRHSENSAECAVVCSVKNGREVTLSWYRGSDMLNETSSPDINTDPSVSLVTEREDNGTYYCLASNPVSNMTTQLNISEVCVQDSATYMQVLGVLCIIVLLSLIVVALYCIYKRLTVIKFEAGHSVEEINYADVSIQGSPSKLSMEVTKATSETENLVQCSEDSTVLYSDVKTLCEGL